MHQSKKVTLPIHSVDFQALVESVKEYAIIMLDPKGYVVSWNAGAENILFYQAVEIIGQHFSCFFPSTDIAEDLPGKKLELAAINGQFEVEGWQVRSDGSHFWASVVITALKDETGQISGFSKITRDITNTKREIDELRQNYQLLRLVIDNIPQASFWKDRNSAYLGCNRQFAQIAGLDSPEQIVGKNDYDMPWKRSESDWYRECDRRIMGTDTPETHIIEPQLQADGTQSWLDTCKIPLHDDRGNVIGLLGTFEDITERKLAEEALEKAKSALEITIAERTSELTQLVAQLQTEIVERKKVEDELKKQQQDYQVIFNTAPAMIWYKDKENKILRVNQAAADSVNLSVSELEGKSIYELYPEEANSYHTDDLEVINSGKQKIGIIEAYQSALRKKRWIQTIKTPYRDPEGNIVGVIVFATDITDRKQAELGLQQSELQLREKATQLEMTLNKLQKTQAQVIQTEKMSSLGQLVGGVAHEINNPVNFISGNLSHAESYTQNLMRLVELYQQQYSNPTPEIQAYIDDIDLDFIMEDLPKILTSMKVGANRIRQIVLSLRNFSRLDEADMKAVNIHEGIDSTLMLLQNRFKITPNNPEILVIREYGNLPEVECYAGQLNQVFMHIITNALDALEEREQQRSLEELKLAPSQIRICTENIEDNRIRIRIADNGLGIPEEIQNRLFDPFFTTKPVGKGTGLGLSICYQIITEKHKGFLQFISQPGNGTEFMIEIPIQQ